MHQGISVLLIPTVLDSGVIENCICTGGEGQGRLDEPFIRLYCYCVFPFFISAATGAAASDCTGTVNAAD